MKVFQTAQGILLKSLIFLFPLFFLPFTIDFFDFPKLALIVVFVLLGFFVWSFSKIQDKNFLGFFVGLRTTPFDIPILLLALSLLVSTVVESGNKINDFVFIGTPTVVLAGFGVYFLLVQYLGGRDGSFYKARFDGVVWSMLAAGSVVSVVTLLSHFGVLSPIGQALKIPALSQKQVFTPIGAIFPTFLFLLLVLPLFAGKLYTSFLDKEKRYLAPLLGVAFLVFLGGLVLTGFLSLPGKLGEYKVLPVLDGWGISLGAIREKPFFGVGPGDFSEAFSRFRDVSYNQTPLWNLAFDFSSNAFLHFLSVSGVFGLASFIFLVWVVARNLLKKRTHAWQGSEVFAELALAICLLLFLLIPPISILLFVFFVLLGLVGAGVGRDIRFEFSVLGFAQGAKGGRQVGINFVAGAFALLSVLAIAAAGLWGGRLYVAEMSYKRAAETIFKQGKYRDVINELVSAIKLVPNVERYRMQYSQVGLSLIRDIVAKGNLTDNDRNDISQLVQLVIAEGKAAVAVNPTSVRVWANLAAVYQAIIPIAKGADQWAVASYQQAIVLEPTNPSLRIGLGGVYYGLGNWDEAAKSFELAVVAKPDLANAHYNLAVALREAKKYDRAAQEMSQTISLLQPGTQDYDKAKKELEDLQTKVKETQAKSGEASPSAKVASQAAQPPLEGPQKVEPQVKPQINLPEESQPPR